MFAKNPKRQARDDAGIVPTIVGSEMMVKGDFKSDRELHVAGKVEGDIQVKTLTVGKDAVIRGAITAEQVRICGDITGCIRARSSDSWRHSVCIIRLSCAAARVPGGGATLGAYLPVRTPRASGE